MGTGFFKAKPNTARVSEPNLMARSIAAPGYAAKGDATLAGKDLGAASALRTAPKGTTKDAAADVKGPRI